jgi:hypothetical protein
MQDRHPVDKRPESNALDETGDGYLKRLGWRGDFHGNDEG